MSVVPIIPAVIPKSEVEVISYTKTFSFSHELHLDVVDGVFVPSVSWPYSPAGEPLAIKHYTDTFTLEVDLMVKEPLKAARDWLKAGADMLVFHIETIDIDSFIDFVDHTDISVGVSFSGDTPIESLFPYLPYAEYVQVMGIHTIGSQGQPFREETVAFIERIKKEFPLLPISVDGSVNKTTITRLVKAGVDRLIIGSAIVGQEHPEAAYRDLVTLVNEC